MSTFTGSKKNIKYAILVDVLIAAILFSISVVQLNRKTYLDIAANPRPVVKLLTVVTLSLHVIAHCLLVLQTNKQDAKFKINHFLKVSNEIIVCSFAKIP